MDLLRVAREYPKIQPQVSVNSSRVMKPRVMNSRSRVVEFLEYDRSYPNEIWNPILLKKFGAVARQNRVIAFFERRNRPALRVFAALFRLSWHILAALRTFAHARGISLLRTFALVHKSNFFRKEIPHACAKVGSAVK